MGPLFSWPACLFFQNHMQLLFVKETQAQCCLKNNRPIWLASWIPILFKNVESEILKIWGFWQRLSYRVCIIYIYILFPYTDTQILRIFTYCIYINIRIYFLTGDVCNNMEISNDSQPQPGLREPIQIAKSWWVFYPQFLWFFITNIRAIRAPRFLVQD